MAEKKSSTQAEKAVSTAKKSGTKSAGKKNSPDSGKKTSPSGGEKKMMEAHGKKQGVLPGRVTAAIITLILFVLFLVIGIKPEGVLLFAIRDLMLSLIGMAAFYFAIPGLLYIFYILVTSRKKPVRMRCICVVVFVLLCGSLYHLFVNNQTLVGGGQIFADLLVSGKNGTSGGLICGGFAMIIKSLLGIVITYILLIVSAILTLLAAMKITVPAIVKAIQERPREEWDEDEFEDPRPEPATVVVNHIANKQIERKRQRREMELERQRKEDEIVLIEALAHPKKSISDEERRKQIMNEVGLDVNDPVGAASVAVADKDTNRTFVVETAAKEKKEKPKAKEIAPEAQKAEPIPSGMPELRMDEPIPEAPKVEPVQVQPENVKQKVTARDTEESAQLVAEEIAKSQNVLKPVYCFPPIDLLKAPMGGAADGTAEMRENSQRLNETLASFRIDAHIINVTRGPSVTRYEVELDKGVRLNKLTTVADDIALSLGAPSVRIAPVPGKISVVGIEVPNRAVTTVSLREVIDSSEFAKSKSKSSFSVGKDIGGNCIVGNIAKMPHMLIAGTTGSGKSVCMNSLIISLLYKSSPEDVKLIMVDPKMVELANYNGIPHLMIPVVTDPKKAAGALQWAVTEMMRRYKTMSDAGVRDLESFNSIMMAEEGEKVPQLVVIIDELADLMLVAAKEVEDSICRIAQMGRAAGIHLVIATQRPSADVITGLMKANIPSRIAFAVASAMESRIILDTQGAEKLVGRGDMLYAPIGTGKPQRVQGCFVSDGEVVAVTDYIKNNYTASYDQTVMEDIEKSAAQTGKKSGHAPDPEPTSAELDGDEMLPAAVDVILETGQASVSMLQRRLKLGYARAARIVDEMEEKGIVGPFQGSKPRSILVTKEQWEAMKSGGESQMDFDDIPFDDAVPEEID